MVIDRLRHINGRRQAISPLWQGLNVAGILGVIAQSYAKFVNRLIQPSIKVA
jgi:hypothetical protein